MPGAHVVTVRVPRSTNYPNSGQLCDVLSTTTTTLTCRTRPHIPFNAGDVVATGMRASASPPGRVIVAHCHDAPQSDIGKEACWLRAVSNAAAARCVGTCTWAYSADVTGSVSGQLRQSVRSGSVVSVQGKRAHAFPPCLRAYMSLCWDIFFGRLGSLSCLQPAHPTLSRGMSCRGHSSDTQT
jgi:hypothetical protein